MKGLFVALTIVFVVRLLYAVVVPTESPDDYQECFEMDEMYRLVHRGYCYYVATSNGLIKQSDAKKNMCGSKGRLAFPNEPTIINFIKNRLGSFYQLTAAVKAWIGLEQMLGQGTPDAGWYYEGGTGEISTIDPALFFFGGIANATCGYSVPDDCVPEYTYRNKTYSGCIAGGEENEIVLGTDCLSGGTCGNDTDCSYTYWGQKHYDCNCPAAAGEENYKDKCFVVQNGVSDGKMGTENNNFQLAIITQHGNILEAAELHQYHYAVCQYKDEGGALLHYKQEGHRISNGVSSSVSEINDVETCAMKCYQSWACAAISYSAKQRLCLLHSIPASHGKAMVVEDAEFVTWDNEL